MRGATSIPTRMPTTATTATNPRKTAAAIRPSMPTIRNTCLASPLVGRRRELADGDAHSDAGTGGRLGGRVTKDSAPLPPPPAGGPAPEGRPRTPGRGGPAPPPGRRPRPPP